MFDDIWQSIEELSEIFNIRETRWTWEKNSLNRLVGHMQAISNHNINTVKNPELLQMQISMWETLEQYNDVLTYRATDERLLAITIADLVAKLSIYEAAFNNLDIAEQILLESLVNKLTSGMNTKGDN